MEMREDENEWIELAEGLFCLTGTPSWEGNFSSHRYFFMGDDGAALVIDPGSWEHKDALLGQNVKQVIVTHEHWDHVCASDAFPAARKAASKWGIDTLNRKDSKIIRHIARAQPFTSTFDHALEDGETIQWGRFTLTILLTPGHTAGSLCVYEATTQSLFTGDTLFNEGRIGHVFDSGDAKKHLKSLKRLRTLDVKNTYPGHGQFIQGKQACLDNLDSAIQYAKQRLV